jgi:hypothetical protein
LNPLNAIRRYQAELDAVAAALQHHAAQPAYAQDAQALAADQARLAELEQQRPAMTQALLRYLLEEQADPDYIGLRLECESARQRCRSLRAALVAWGVKAPADPPPRTQLASGSQRDRLFNEYRALEKLGIRLPLFPDEVVIPPSCPQHRERRERE